MRPGDEYYDQILDRFFDEVCPAYGDDAEIENCLHCDYRGDYGKCKHPEHPKNCKLEDCVFDQL